MKVDIQDVSSYKKVIKIEIPVEDVKAEFEKAYDEIRQNIEVPGFRKGRAPRNILKSRFGEYIKSEVFKNLVIPAVEKAVKENNLKVLGTPDIYPSSDEILFNVSSEFQNDLDNNILSVELQQEFRNNKAPLSDSATLSIEERGRVWTVADDKNNYRIVADKDKLNVYSNEFDIDENKPLVFEAAADVRPKIEIPNFSELEIEKGDVNVTKEEVDEVIEKLRREKATLVPREDRPLQDSDLATFDIKITQDDLMIINEKDSETEIIKEKVLPEFYNNVLGMNVNSEVEFNASLPENYHDKKIAGKEVKFHVVLKEIKEIQLPELDDEFAKDLGEENLNHLITNKWNQLVETKRNIQRNNQVDDILTQLMEKINFEIPERVIDEIVDNFSKKIKLTTDETDYLTSSDKEKLYRNMAENFIKKKWIFEEIAEQQNIKVSEEELERVVYNIALSKNKDPQKYMLQLKAVDRLDDIMESIKEDKIYELLIEKASEKRRLII